VLCPAKIDAAVASCSAQWAFRIFLRDAIPKTGEEALSGALVETVVLLQSSAPIIGSLFSPGGLS